MAKIDTLGNTASFFFSEPETNDKCDDCESTDKSNSQVLYTNNNGNVWICSKCAEKKAARDQAALERARQEMAAIEAWDRWEE